jgi:hypothetical protein
MSLIIIGELCPSCQKYRSPAEMVQHAGFRECVPCGERHREAMESLATGTPPKECSECGTSWEELRARGEQSMVCHMEAGRYRIMCHACDARYVPKRRELYGPTPFGRALGLAK